MRPQDELLVPHYPHPEFDLELCHEVIQQIIHKTVLSESGAQELGAAITTSIGFLCSAFEYRFVDEIDAKIGNDLYAVHVYLSRDNQISL